jgi:predicted transcriptional regulator
MPRKPSLTLTEAELPLMEALWHRGTATVSEVADSLPKDKPVAYNTVLTMLRILERKGYVRHTKEGRAFVYQPMVGRGEASRNAVRQVLNRFFHGSPELLVLNLLKDETIDARELERLKAMTEGD